MRQDRSVIASVARLTALAVMLLPPVLGYAQEPGLDLRISPEAGLPLGSDSDVFQFVPGAEISLLFAPSALPWLFGSAGVGYGVGLIPLDTTLSLIRGSASLGFRVPGAGTTTACSMTAARPAAAAGSFAGERVSTMGSHLNSRWV